MNESVGQCVWTNVGQFLSFKFILRPIIGQILDPSNCKFLIYETLSNLIFKKTHLKTTKGKYQQQNINIQPKNNTSKMQTHKWGMQKLKLRPKPLAYHIKQIRQGNGREAQKKISHTKGFTSNNSSLQSRSSQTLFKKSSSPFAYKMNTKLTKRIH